jgi:hypothetical protein
MFSWVLLPTSYTQRRERSFHTLREMERFVVAAGLQNPTEASAQARLLRPDYPMGTKLISTDKLASRQRLIAHLLTRFSLLIRIRIQDETNYVTMAAWQDLVIRI